MNKPQPNMDACNHGVNVIENVMNEFFSTHKEIDDMQDVLAGAFSCLCAIAASHIGYERTMKILAVMSRSTIEQIEDTCNTKH